MGVAKILVGGRAVPNFQKLLPGAPGNVHFLFRNNKKSKNCEVGEGAWSPDLFRLRHWISTGSCHASRILVLSRLKRVNSMHWKKFKALSGSVMTQTGREFHSPGAAYQNYKKPRNYDKDVTWISNSLKKGGFDLWGCGVFIYLSLLSLPAHAQSKSFLKNTRLTSSSFNYMLVNDRLPIPCSGCSVYMCT